MKMLLSLALIASFATLGFAQDAKEAPKKEAPKPAACKMECCKKAGTDCKSCPECSKKAAKGCCDKDKKECPKKDDAKKS